MGIFGIFTATVLFLAIEIKGDPIFHHIYTVISPMTLATQDAIERFFDRSMNHTQRYSRKLFENSVPKVNDAIKSKMSGVKKSAQDPTENITESERSQLNDLIKSH